MSSRIWTQDLQLLRVLQVPYPENYKKFSTYIRRQDSQTLESTLTTPNFRVRNSTNFEENLVFYKFFFRKNHKTSRKNPGSALIKHHQRWEHQKTSKSKFFEQLRKTLQTSQLGNKKH